MHPQFERFGLEFSGQSSQVLEIMLKYLFSLLSHLAKQSNF